MLTDPASQESVTHTDSVQDFKILHPASQPVFDALVASAAHMCSAPMAALSVIDAHSQWTLAAAGLPAHGRLPRHDTLCALAVEQPQDFFEICDVHADALTQDHSVRQRAPSVRSYASAAVRVAGVRLGVLCVFDVRARSLQPHEREGLLGLARAAAAALELRRDALEAHAERQRFDALCRSAPMAVFTTDRLGRLTYANPNWQRMFGSEGQSPSAAWAAACASHDVAQRSQIERDWRRALAQAQPFAAQLRMGAAATAPAAPAAAAGASAARADAHDAAGAGELGVSDVHIRAVPLHAGAHSRAEPAPHSARSSACDASEPALLEGFVGCAVDMSQTMRHERELQRAQQMLETTGSLTQVGGWSLDVQTRALWWSRQTREIHAVADSYEPDLESALAFYDAAGQIQLRQALSKCCVSNQGWDLELELTDAAATRRWVRVVGRPERQGSHVVRLAGAIQDITAQREQRQALEVARERLDMAMRLGRTGMWEVDLQTHRHTWSAQAWELLGLTGAEGLSPKQALLEAIEPADREKLRAATASALATRAALTVTIRARWPDGSQHYLRCDGQAVRDAGGQPVRLLGVVSDVTQLMTLNERLTEQHELLRVTLQSIGDAVITTDTDSLVTWLNPVAEQLTGWTLEDAHGRHVRDVFEIHDPASHARLGEDFVADSMVCRVTERPSIERRAGGRIHASASTSAPATTVSRSAVLVSRQGRHFGVQASASAIRSPDAGVLGAVVAFRDVSEQQRLTSEMSYRASHDLLTGLLNRDEFQASVQGALQELRSADPAPEAPQHALLHLDLDWFHLLNDSCGQDIGDMVLRDIARILSARVRDSDALARLGSDEFALLLKHCPATIAERLAGEICEELQAKRFSFGNRSFRVGASIGLVTIDARWPGYTAAMQAAVAACNAAKEGGRGRVHVWTTADRTIQSLQDSMHWAALLEQALDEQRLELHAQRLMALDHGKAHAPGVGTNKAEVLLRLREKTGKLVSPALFMSAAERFGLAPRIDLFVLQRVMEILDSVEPHVCLTLCVNVSGMSLSDLAFQPKAMKMLREASALARSRLCVEVTETAEVVDLTAASAFIHSMRAAGVRVAIDDFGVGASFFGSAKQLTVDYLKVDGSFIRNLTSDPLDEVALQSFVALARELGVQTVAECVQDADVLERVTELGVNWAQGFFIHRPEPIEAVVEHFVQSQPALDRVDAHDRMPTGSIFSGSETAPGFEPDNAQPVLGALHECRSLSQPGCAGSRDAAA